MPLWKSFTDDAAVSDCAYVVDELSSVTIDGFWTEVGATGTSMSLTAVGGSISCLLLSYILLYSAIKRSNGDW